MSILIMLLIINLNLEQNMNPIILQRKAIIAYFNFQKKSFIIFLVYRTIMQGTILYTLISNLNKKQQGSIAIK